MKRLFLCTAILLSAFTGNAQIKVDTTKNAVVVTDKSPKASRTLSIYTTYLSQKEKTHMIVYLPDAVTTEDENNALRLVFATELAQFNNMMAAARPVRQYNFTRLSLNIMPYRDLVAKLVDLYANSPEWNAYLKSAKDLHRTYKLDMGEEVTEISYDPVLALKILNSSDVFSSLNDVLMFYGYRATNAGFPDDHQEILTPAELKKLGKTETLFIPVPDAFFNLTRIKK